MLIIGPMRALAYDGPYRVKVRNKPPVFGTAVPLRGLSGAIRRLADRAPDHKPRHWVLKMLGDRVESWGHRARRLLIIALPIAGIALVVRRQSA